MSCNADDAACHVNKESMLNNVIIYYVQGKLTVPAFNTNKKLQIVISFTEKKSCTHS